MSIQRMKHSITVMVNMDKTEVLVDLNIECKGQFVDRSDALTMIACALIEESEKLGLDPVKAVQTMKNSAKGN